MTTPEKLEAYYQALLSDKHPENAGIDTLAQHGFDLTRRLALLRSVFGSAWWTRSDNFFDPLPRALLWQKACEVVR